MADDSIQKLCSQLQYLNSRECFFIYRYLVNVERKHNHSFSASMDNKKL